MGRPLPMKAKARLQVVLPCAGECVKVSLPVAMGREFGFVILRWCRQFASTSSYEARQGQGKPTMSHVQNVGVEANESLGFPAHLRHIRSCCATLFYFDFPLSSFSSFVVGWALRLLLPCVLACSFRLALLLLVSAVLLALLLLRREGASTATAAGHGWGVPGALLEDLADVAWLDAQPPE